MEIGLKMASTLSEWRDKAPQLNFEETELRLGLSGGGGGGGGSQRETAASNNNNSNSNGKRGYSETVLDLELNISSKERMGTDDSNEIAKNLKKEIKSLLTCSKFPAKPPAKAQVVGWPPVQSFRKKIGATRKRDGATNNDEESCHDKAVNNNNNASLVKVSMDGAPYLRKVDLKIYKSYQELSDALGKMFSSFTIGNCGSQGMMDFMNESKLMDLLNDSDFVPTYEDKEGDWMLVGDVPWEMFVKLCKRLRIMKGTEAKGLAPRAMEKCKNRT